MNGDQVNDSFDMLEQLLTGGSKDSNPDKRETPEQKTKVITKSNPGKERRSRRPEPAGDVGRGVFQHSVYFTDKEYMLLRLMAMLSGRSISAIVRDGLSGLYGKLESWWVKNGISDLSELKTRFDKEF